MTKESTKRLWTGILVIMAVFLLIPWLRAEAAEPQVAAGAQHTVGLKSDGTVVAVGTNSEGQTNVGEWANIVAVAAGVWHTVGLKSDGKVVAVGRSNEGQTDVSSWADITITAVAAGDSHTVGLKSDGKVVAAGDNSYGQRNVGDWTNIVAISVRGRHTVGLKSDGTAVAVGWNDYGQTDVTGTAWANIVAVSAGLEHTVGLKSNGSVVTAGDNYYGQRNVDDWTNIVAVAAGGEHTVGLKSDGSVVAVGDNGYGQTDVGGWTNIIAVAAGGSSTVGLRSDGTVVAVGDTTNSMTNVGAWQLDTITEVRGVRGTPVILEGTGFGPKKGTVLVGIAPAQVTAWSDSMIVFQMTKTLSPGEYPIHVTPKGATSAVSYEKAFNAKAPKAHLVLANKGASGDLVVLSGKYFGLKKGKVLLGTKVCQVAYWYMAPETGRSMAAFVIPARMTPGSYNLTVMGEAGSSSFLTPAFTVISGTTAHSAAFHGEVFPDEGD